MKCKVTIFAFLLFALLPGASLAQAQSPKASCAVVIEAPHSGQTMPNRIEVEGTATLPSGHHLWVFARRYDFEPLWWIQGEGTVNPKTHQWRRFATLGGDDDIGWKFDLTAAIVSPEQHQLLAERFAQDMDDKNYRPLEMPGVACAASMVRVTRKKN